MIITPSESAENMTPHSSHTRRPHAEGDEERGGGEGREDVAVAADNIPTSTQPTINTPAPDTARECKRLVPKDAPRCASSWRIILCVCIWG